MAEASVGSSNPTTPSSGSMFSHPNHQLVDITTVSSVNFNFHLIHVEFVFTSFLIYLGTLNIDG